MVAEQFQPSPEQVNTPDKPESKFTGFLKRFLRRENTMVPVETVGQTIPEAQDALAEVLQEIRNYTVADIKKLESLVEDPSQISHESPQLIINAAIQRLAELKVPTFNNELYVAITDKIAEAQTFQQLKDAIRTDEPVAAEKPAESVDPLAPKKQQLIPVISGEKILQDWSNKLRPLAIEKRMDTIAANNAAYDGASKILAAFWKKYRELKK